MINDSLESENQELRKEIAFRKLTESERNKQLEASIHAMTKEIDRLLGHIRTWGKALRNQYRRQVNAKRISR